MPEAEASRLRHSLIWQFISYELRRKIRAANRQHNVLLSAEHICHRGAGFSLGHINGAKFLAGHLVISAEHCTLFTGWRGEDAGFARDHQSFRHQHSENSGTPGSWNSEPLECRMVANVVRRLPMCDLPQNLSLVKVDRGDAAIRRFGERQSLNSQRRRTFGRCSSPSAAGRIGGGTRRPGGSIDIRHIGSFASWNEPNVAHLAPGGYVSDVRLRIV